MEHIFNSHSILQVLQGKEVTMATSYRLGCSDWTLGKMSLSEHNGAGCPERVPEVCFSTHQSVLFSLKGGCFWTDPLEKQKAFMAATSIPILLLYIQYIQYCTFHVKFLFIDLAFLQPTLIWIPPVQQMHNKEVFETEGDTLKSIQNDLTDIKQQKSLGQGVQGYPSIKKTPNNSKWQWTHCSTTSCLVPREGYRQTRDCAGIVQMIKHQGTDTRPVRRGWGNELVQPAEHSSWGRPKGSPPAPEGSPGESGAWFPKCSMVGRGEAVGRSWNERFGLLDVKKSLFTTKTVKHWKRLYRKLVRSPFLEVFRTWLDKHLVSANNWCCFDQEVGLEI